MIHTKALLPGQCCLWLLLPLVFPVGSQDSPEALVPEQEGLLDSQRAQGRLSAELLLPAGSLCLSFFLTDIGSAHDLEAANFPGESQFPHM